MLNLLKTLGGTWEQSRDPLYRDLESIETILNRRWAATFGNTSVLPTGSGGTGTSTTFTEGSIVFAGPLGVYSQRNSQLFWDDTNFRLGVGTNSPSCTLETYSALGNTATGNTGTLISGKRDDLTGRFFQVEALDAAGAHHSYPFEIARDNGIVVNDYLVVGGQRKTDGTFETVFGANAGMIACYPDLAATSTTSMLYFVSNGSGCDFFHLDSLASIDVDGTLHGTRQFTFTVAGKATAGEGWIAPRFVGGEVAGSTCEIRTTYGNANASAYTKLTTGNNGSLLGLYLDNAGRIGIGGITNPATNLEVLGAEQRLRGSGSNISYWAFYDSGGTTRRGTVGNVLGDMWLNSDTGAIQLIPSTRLKAYPGSNSTTAFQFFKADATTVVTTIDTSTPSLDISTQASVYGTAIDPTNYERVRLAWDGTQYNLFTERAGTGTAKQLRLGVGSTSVWVMDTSGNLATSNSAGSAQLAIGRTGVIGFGDRGNLFAFADGKLRVASNSAISGVILDVGTVDTQLRIRKKDDTDWGNVSADSIIANGGPSGTAGFLCYDAGFFYWSSRSAFSSPADGQINLTKNSTTTGVGLDVATDGTLKVRTRAQTADAQLSAASVRGTAVTFANRPGTAVEGMLVAFTDSTTTTWGATITGTGANHVLGYYNGTNWTVAAI